MSRRCCLVFVALIFFASTVFAIDDAALWREYGLLHSSSAQDGKSTVTTYELKDPTGALAAWEWQRSPQGKPCKLAALCTEENGRTVISDYNYVLVFGGPRPAKAQVDAAVKALPNKHDTSLPAILTFLPRQGLVADSARYVLGPVSLANFAPELSAAKPGFDSGAEAQVAEYRADANESPVRLALFYYPTPEMARIHAGDFKHLPNVHVKRSGVLVALVFGPATGIQVHTLLSRIQYEAKITWNDTPPPSPIKPLYQLLLNIMYVSIILTALCLMAGLIYAGMRVYRRRYGNLESEEAMTTLHLS